MDIYKYPVKYFCGPNLLRFTKELIGNNMSLFGKRFPITTPITGETGIDGVLLDFNCGLRLQIPEGNWHVQINDAESELNFLDEDISGVTLISMEKFYIEWEIALWLDGKPMFYHRLDPTNQKVHFMCSPIVPVIGDNLIFLTYIEAFRHKFDCDASLTIPNALHCLVEQYYPEIRLSETLPEDSYACYFMMTAVNMPIGATEESKNAPLLRAGHAILRCLEEPPKIIFHPTEPRSIKEPYVCIGAQASTPAKGWLNPDGWNRVVEYLKSIGYRVLCIDRNRIVSEFGNTIEMPAGAEDFTGNYTLLDRVNQLAYADFFIGLGSGLSWLAWAVDIPIVLISGISERWCEFNTPYRINNPLVCHGCFNVVAHHRTMNFCPLYKDTDRAYECSKKISARQVINAINRLIADHNLLEGSEG